MANSERTLNRTERLFSLVLLLQSRPNMSSKDLAEHFGVSRRTIFRDLRALGESGVPLTYAEEGGYEILEGYQLPPLMLTAREAATLLMGTEFTRLQSDASLARDADQVGMKIESVLPREVQEYIDRLRASLVMDPYWLHQRQRTMAEDEEGRWYDLSQAVANQKKILMEYFVASRNEVTRRTVDPLGLVYYTDHWNLLAYDHLRDDVRNFRLDQIRTLRILMEKFERPPGFDLSAHLEERGESPANLRVVIRFHHFVFASAHRGIPARVEEEVQEGDWIRVTFYFENMDYVAGWLLRFGSQAEVLEPKELMLKVKEKALSTAALYSDS